MKKIFTLILLMRLFASCGENANVDPIVEDKSYTFDFANLDFTGNIYDTSVNEKLMTHVNKETSLVSSITDNYQSSQIMKFKQNGIDEINRFTIGSSKSAGSVTFNFSTSIKSISITAIAYYKFIPFSSTYSIDSNSKLYINNDNNEMGFEINEDADQIEKTCKFTFLEATNSINFYNLDGSQRAQILSFTIFY